MEIKIQDLLVLQDKVDKKVKEKTNYDITANDLALAMHVEAFEFINTVGTWKWWKHSHKLNQERILDELADNMAFCFAYINSLTSVYGVKVAEESEALIQEIVNEVLSDNKISAETLIKTVSGTIISESSLGLQELLAVCICIAAKTLDISWSDIEDAYIKKSQENIKRQENNY